MNRSIRGVSLILNKFSERYFFFLSRIEIQIFDMHFLGRFVTLRGGMTDENSQAKSPSVLSDIYSKSGLLRRLDVVEATMNDWA
jgi:hypothetical protein